MAQRSWSLVRRLTAGVVLIALLSFVVQALVLGLWLRPLASDVANASADQALLVQRLLAAVPAAERTAMAQQLQLPGLVLSQSEPAFTQNVQPVRPPFVDLLESRLGASGITLRIESRPEHEATITFGLPVAGEQWWLSRTVVRPTTALSGTLMVWLAMLALATAGALWVSVRLIARPIGALAEEITSQRGELRPLAAPTATSRELQAVVQAFNRLVQQVQQNAQVRQQLLAGVSHDLRTPLARLRLRAETQAEGALSESLTSDVQAIEHIVNQFLAYVQGDAQALASPAEPLTASVNDVLRRYRGAGQPIEGRVEDVALQAPALAVQRALGNLIDNALAHGRAPVQVQLQQAGPAVELRVVDQGPGMSDDEFTHAQQPFVRLNGTRSELGHCGLGLAIVAQLARQLHAELLARHNGEGYAVVLRFGSITGTDRALRAP